MSCSISSLPSNSNAIEQIIKQNSKCVKAYFRRAQAYHALGLWHFLGSITEPFQVLDLTTSGDFNEAMQDLDRAGELDPKDPVYACNACTLFICTIFIPFCLCQGHRASQGRLSAVQARPG
jgi:hypothetical protein